jgi:hypothetical protein
MTEPLAHRLADLARHLQEERGVDATLDAIVRAAVDAIPGAGYAGISQVEDRRRVRTTAATADLVMRVDQAQYDTGEGPCLESLFRERTVRAPDLRSERRWPAFTARTRELGVGGILAFQLYVARDNLGALNVYSGGPDDLGDAAERVGSLFAAHAAVVLADTVRIEQLTHAIDVRDLIGQAKGILMERHKVTGQQAFALLVRASQETNVKLTEVARHLVETGELAAGSRDLS